MSVVPIGYACDNCKWVFPVSVVQYNGVWYEKKDNVVGDYWVCPNCEEAQRKVEEELDKVPVAH